MLEVCTRHARVWPRTVTVAPLGFTGLNHQLHVLTFWLAVVLCIAVEVVLIMTEIRRPRGPREGALAGAPGARPADVLWLLGPALLLAFLIVLAAPAALRPPSASSGLTTPST